MKPPRSLYRLVCLINLPINFVLTFAFLILWEGCFVNRFVFGIMLRWITAANSSMAVIVAWPFSFVKLVCSSSPLKLFREDEIRFARQYSIWLFNGPRMKCMPNNNCVRVHYRCREWNHKITLQHHRGWYETCLIDGRVIHEWTRWSNGFIWNGDDLSVMPKVHHLLSMLCDWSHGAKCSSMYNDRQRMSCLFHKIRWSS